MDYVRVYARQEYLTPGAAETVAWFAEAARPDTSSRILEVAAGKGEAACTLAARFGCRITAVDRFLPFLDHVRGKVHDRGLDALVALLRADGRRLPLPDASHDAAYCIGAPSIVGAGDCLRELRRTVRRGGVATWALGRTDDAGLDEPLLDGPALVDEAIKPVSA